MLLFLNSYQVLGTLVDGCLNDEDNCKEIRSIIPKSSIRSFKLRFLANPEYNLVRNSQESFRHSLITYTFFPSKKYSARSRGESRSLPFLHLGVLFTVSFSLLFILHLFLGIPSCISDAIKGTVHMRRTGQMKYHWETLTSKLVIKTLI